MARITASVFTSHVPAIGAALDLGKTAEPYWQPVFQGYEFSKQWMKDKQPDVIIQPGHDPHLCHRHRGAVPAGG